MSIRSFARDNAVMSLLRAQKVAKVDYDQTAKNLGNYGAEKIRKIIDAAKEKPRYTEFIAIILRDKPDERGVGVTILPNEDVLAALKAVCLGIHPSVAVELAYRDLLVSRNIDDTAFPHLSDYRLVATFTPTGQPGSTDSLFAHKNARDFSSKLQPHECLLLWTCDATGEVSVPLEGFWSSYAAHVGTCSETEDVYYWQLPEEAEHADGASVLSDLPPGFRTFVTEQTAGNLEGADPGIRAGYLSGTTIVCFNHRQLIATAALIHAGLPPRQAAAVVASGRAQAVKLDEPLVEAFLSTGNVEPFDVVTMGDGVVWAILCDDLTTPLPYENVDCWALSKKGQPIEITPGENDPTRALNSKVPYRCLIKTGAEAWA